VIKYAYAIERPKKTEPLFVFVYIFTYVHVCVYVWVKQEGNLVHMYVCIHVHIDMTRRKKAALFICMHVKQISFKFGLPLWKMFLGSFATPPPLEKVSKQLVTSFTKANKRWTLKTGS
jgi:hypothetical protein